MAQPNKQKQKTKALNQHYLKLNGPKGPLLDPNIKGAPNKSDLFTPVKKFKKKNVGRKLHQDT